MLRQLYPQSKHQQPLQGSYLDLKLHLQAKKDDIFIYANYISSLDGRISLLDAESGEFGVPDSLGNKRDWRLYQELAGQSDVMITSARYFRQFAKGEAQDLLPVGKSPDFAYIQAWRKQQGMKAQPDVVILSHTLDIPAAALQSFQDRNIMVLTNNDDAQKVTALQGLGVAVQVVQGEVTGKALRQSLVSMDYRSAYMIAGPQVFRTLLTDACLDALFLTTAMRLLGGTSFHTLLESRLPSPVHLQLKSLYMDEQGGQLFQQYFFPCSHS